MSKTLSLFGEGNPLASSELFQQLQTMNDTLAGSEGQYKRISIRGGKFRQIVNGEQVAISKDDTMNIVIIDAAPVARTYFEGTYDPDAKPVPPVCWSADTNTPHPDVPEPQASRCADCPQNVKGSGQGNSRACRFSQRLAVAIENDMDTVYQLQLPATSIFGDATENAMPMQGYARLLRSHKTPVIAVVTEMRFDHDADVPKLFFRPVRPLTEEELQQAVALRDTDEAKAAIELTVSQVDGVQSKPAMDTEVKDSTVTDLFPDAKNETEEKQEEVAEPTKVVKKTAAPPPSETEDLSKIITDWDDA